jgi:hypothetical protein
VFVFFATLISFLSLKQSLFAQSVSAFLLQVTIGLTLLLTLGLNADAKTYHLAAVAQSQMWRGIEPSNEFLSSFSSAMAPGKQLFTWILSLFYFTFGPNPIMGIILNAFFMSLVVICLANATSGFGFLNSKNLAAWLAVFTPPFLYWAPYVTREALSFLLLSLTVLAASLVYQKNLKLGLPIYFFSFQMFVFTRAQLTLVVLASLFIVFISARYSFFRNKNAYKIFQPWALLLSIFFMVVLARSQLSPYFTTAKNNIPSQVRSNSSANQGLAVPHKNSDVASPLVLSEHAQVSSSIDLIRDIFLTLWGPPAWQWLNLKFTVSGLDGLGYLVISTIIIITFLSLRHYRWQITTLVFSLSPLIAGTVATLANYGIVMRVRAHFLPFLIPILALGIAHRKEIFKSINAKVRSIIFIFSKGK